MFYLAVEEFVLQNRQRELAKELELKRQLRDSLESKSDNWLHFLAEIGDRLRNLGGVFEAGTSMKIEDETPLDCVAC